MNFTGNGFGNMFKFVSSTYNLFGHFLKEMFIRQGVQDRLDLFLVIEQYSLDGKG
ncbi:hypothetical protein [Paenibacillus sp. RC67]|uniref:hypothetical protein n=1 Tax=Paenibacillus sp. RC67 TaxID=3039392 RepID=UPI0024AD2D93|nr:hypothetical protein [Paenibacillus sp. RC67]